MVLVIRLVVDKDGFGLRYKQKHDRIDEAIQRTQRWQRVRDDDEEESRQDKN